MIVSGDRAGNSTVSRRVLVRRAASSLLACAAVILASYAASRVVGPGADGAGPVSVSTPPPRPAASSDAVPTNFPGSSQMCQLLAKLNQGGIRDEIRGVRFVRDRVGSGPTAGVRGAVRVRYLCVKPDRTVVSDNRQTGEPELWSAAETPSIGMGFLLPDMRAGDRWRVMAPPNRVFTVNAAKGEWIATSPAELHPPLAVDEVRLYEIEVVEVLNSQRGTFVPAASGPEDTVP